MYVNACVSGRPSMWLATLRGMTWKSRVQIPPQRPRHAPKPPPCDVYCDIWLEDDCMAC